MNITRGKKTEAQKVVIYGPEGIGKSTLASHFPNPVFIDTEGSTGHMDVARMDAPSSFSMLIQEIKYIKNHPDVCSTLIIDTADWAEQLCISEFCAKKQIAGIEDIGYGKGYVYIAEDFGRMLNLLEDVKGLGINVVITAHAQMRKFEQPDELGGYDRWELKLQKKTAPLLKEWADMVLFANYKTIVVNVDNQGAQKGKNKAQGGMRVLYTTHHVCWDAKNRHELPNEIPMDFSAIAHCIPVLNQINVATTVSEPQQIKSPVKEVATTTQTFQQPEQQPVERTGEPNKTDATVQEKQEETTLEGVPKKLADLMLTKAVTIEEVQEIVTLRGYYPKGTLINNYDPSFIDGVLVGAWEKVYGMIRAQKISRGEFLPSEGEEIPFN